LDALQPTSVLFRSLNMKITAILLSATFAILPLGAPTPFEDVQEMAGECKVVFVDGAADHCVIVIPGTDTPVSLPKLM
jgi:hypothetical protein